MKRDEKLIYNSGTARQSRGLKTLFPQPFLTGKESTRQRKRGLKFTVPCCSTGKVVETILPPPFHHAPF